MYLKHVEIQGFKSFPDKTRLTFGKEITAIVGPNGSGKSNISDAVRWVLGEQSSKSLRCGKMEDVIFGGAQQRRPMGYAYVTLCLDNTDGRIPDFGQEVIISRRIYRSGESEYLIDGSAVRLRDLREAFMDTGLSRDGYSIIEQGRISEIVAAKSIDRREIFEEASGIAKYRFRKTEAQRKLMQAEENLLRLRDILDELENRVGPLKEQSDTAKRFLELSSELKNLEVTLDCENIERSKRSVNEQEDRIETAKKDYNEVEQRLIGIDSQFQKNHDLRVELIGKTNDANAEINTLNEEITETERALVLLESEIAHDNDRIAALVRDKENISSSGEETAERITAKIDEINEHKQMLADIELGIEDAEKQLELLAGQDAESDRELKSIAGELSRLSGELTELRIDSASRKPETDSLKSRINEIESALPGLAERQVQTSEKQRFLDDALIQLDEMVVDTENRKNGYALKLNSRRQSLDKLDAEILGILNACSETEHRISALEDMEKSMEGYARSVKMVLEASQAGSLRGIIGTISSLISIEKGCETAIETALGNNIQNIVVEDEQAAKDAIRMLREEKAGRATFLPLDTVRRSSFDMNEELRADGVVGIASSLVKYDKAYENIIASLLGRIVVARDLDTASVVARKMSYRYRIVTMDGQVINAGGSYTGGFIARSAGMFSRRNEIERLSGRLDELKKSLEEKQPALSALKDGIAKLQAEMTALESEIVNLQTDRVRIVSETGYAGTDAENAVRAVKAAQDEMAGLVEKTKQLEKQTEDDVALYADIERKIAELEDSESAAQTRGGEFSENRGRLTELLYDRKVARMEKLRDIESLEEGLASLNASKEGELGKAGDIDVSIAQTEQLNQTRIDEIDINHAELEKKHQRIQTLRLEIDRAVEKQMSLDRENSDAREEQNRETRLREDIGREISKLEERKISLRRDYDNTIARLWEKYELSLSEAKLLCVEFTSVTALTRTVGQLRNGIKALGYVNVGAIEEYREVNERYIFLSEQVNDVEQSKQQLISLIDTLTAEMKTIFVSSFEQIGRHFRSVFIEMFSGGRASLSLSDETDVLESGIEIDVQPPGKVIKNLASLSGGEQSLVSIALFFAILKVNPAPFCILDEIDSSLDEINVARFAGYLPRLVENTQLISITHRRGTMEAADVLYGVTMQEEGVSKVLKLSLNEARLVVSN